MPFSRQLKSNNRDGWEKAPQHNEGREKTMKYAICPFLLSVVMLGLFGLTAAASIDDADTKGDARVADAYARGSDGGFVWTIGTKLIQMTFDGRGGVFRLVGFLNKSCEPPLEYVDPKTAAAPFVLGSNSPAKPDAEADGPWRLKAAAAREAASGGRPAVQLDLTLARGEIRTKFHVLAFPGTSILRQWVEIENAGSRPIELKSPAAARFQLRGAEATSYVNSWINGMAHQNMGQQPVSAPYRKDMTTTGAYEFFPWTALHRSDGPKDGLFVALEYVGTWSLAIDHGVAGPLTVTAGLPDLKAVSLKPGQRLTSTTGNTNTSGTTRTPIITHVADVRHGGSIARGTSRSSSPPAWPST
jgi:hypothetical protein